MKVGLCTTTHRSNKFRARGSEFLQGFLDSFRNSNFNYEYKIYVNDNASEIPFEYPEDLNIDAHYIEDQTLEGITGAWNSGFRRAYSDGCDIIWNFNDDIILNESINNFIEVIQNFEDKDNTLFGPASDNGGHGSPNSQNGIEEGIKRLKLRQGTWDNLPNGFSFAFTRKFYEKYRANEQYMIPLDHKGARGDGMWGGQEGYFGLLVDDGLKAVIVKSCWIKHHKTRGWVYVRDSEKKQ